MSRILHISDRHLGTPLERQYLDSHRAAMAASDRRSQRDVFRESIESREEDGALANVDAVVITGDLTNRAGADGFDEFKSIVEMITPHVDTRNIVAVPGNHDVPQDHGPGDPVRYTEFLRITRDIGLVTPMLDSQDFKEDGTLNETSLTVPHLVQGSDFVIVPLNSSHYCWGTEPLPDDVFDDVLTVPEDKLLEATEKLRRFDVPRISNAQMHAVGLMLNELVDPSASSDR